MYSKNTLRAMGFEFEENYAWVITKIGPGLRGMDMDDLVGTIGPASCPDELDADAIKRHPQAERFRVRDDDGELYYYGSFVNLDGEASGLEPLDDYGTPSLGATSIEYRCPGGEWRVL